MIQRRATYRLQLHQGFGFGEAAAQADYLAALGVSHAYCSPYLQAARGSTHGYDVVDPTRISADLGGEDGHRVFTETLRARGLGQLLDIVPNHMSVADPRNRWWWDVLADGMSSPYARFFDIDWAIDEPKMRHRVLLPVLGDQVGRVLEEGGISVVREQGSVLIASGDDRYPLSVESVAELLAAASTTALRPILDRVASLPDAADPASRRDRFERRAAILSDVAGALADSATAAAVDEALADRNADIAGLDRLLGEQHHRLARWQTAVEEINYRRFFDINTLVALRIEDPAVFEEATALIAGLVRRGDVDGLRIDHIDGLRRPLEYAGRLREATLPTTWLVAEKILGRGEQPPPWPLDGTSGYDFLAVVNGLFVDPDGRERLEALHSDVTGNGADFERAARDGKREILRTSMVSDVERLSLLLATVSDAYPAHRDHTHTELTEAIVELIAAVPVYRTYLVPAQGPASDVEAGIIRGAAAQAHGDNPDVDPRLLDFVADLFVFGEPEDLATSDTSVNRQAQNDLVLRMQQLCAAATAKGVEDTAFYRHVVLLSLNEVGGSPADFGTGVAEFHEHNQRVQQQHPMTLLTTSTHDTKRSEDVRCRIDVLSEVPDQWAAAVHRWRAMNAGHREEVIDGTMEYVLYQTLVGAHPLDADRAVAYMGKASREARQHTAWLRPDDHYEAALAAFVAAILEDARFTADLDEFVTGLIPHGRINSLSTTLLKLTSPGVPDVYQGTELWDLSLVDPDNRRPVDYALRVRLLDTARAAPLDVAWTIDPDSGAAKIGLIAAALAVRARRPEAFDDRGAYTPIRPAGEFADDVIAFTRGGPASVLSLTQRRSMRRRGNWGDTMITLPDGLWKDACTGAGWRDGVRIAELLGAFPVAL
ncbi:MAG: (1-_4)-alpha-D-glucan 1-alpha-D-glucosylmutase, partial [Pseudonocardiales bacterium]|nr:(1->4)-alpha-D-glucan 1-alpha-D-glucosylmutase [Pseudonocardiales bacterium]